jgi:REP element-mobilizing transposase RayT
MKHDHHRPARRSIRLKEYDYADPGAYFVTICVSGKRFLFGRLVRGQVVLNEYGQAVQACWLGLPDHYLNMELDAFVVMPNHVHGIFIITDVRAGLRPARKGAASKRPALPEIVRAFKAFCSRRINEMRGTRGARVWQRNYYEHVIRDEQSLNRVREYIVANPERWDLDRENPERRGEDEFDRWLATFKEPPKKRVAFRRTADS